jgi:hypothetical protein
VGPRSPPSPPLIVHAALTQLNRLSKGTDRISTDARDAIVWLDTVTEDPAIEGRVQLEGVDEAYETWAEVEQFLLPETLLSIEDVPSDDDESDFADDLEDSFANLDVSDGTSMSSSHSLDDRPKTPPSESGVTFPTGKHESDNVVRRDTLVQSPDRTARNSGEIRRTVKSAKSRSAVPADLKPFFNHILWRIHKETNPDAALESFILLTNDPVKQAIAQKFGIRAKRLEQLRDAVAREDREYRNHQMLNKIESGELKPSVARDDASSETKAADRPTSSHTENEPDSSDEDVVVMKRAPRGPQAETVSTQRLFDPNDFGRTNNNRGGRGGRGRGGFVGPPRGRGAPAPRGRGGFVPRGAYTPPVAQPFRPPPAPRAPPADANGLLNPDSYERPAPRVNTLRGGRRRLWEPN